MFRCGKTLIALALLMANPVAALAQTADNPPAPSSSRRNRRANRRQLPSC